LVDGRASEKLSTTSTYVLLNFNESIGLELKIDIDLNLLIKEEIGILHEERASSYRNVIVSRQRRSRIKSIFVTLDEYFRESVRPWNGALKKLQAKALERPPLSSLHLDQFHLGRIQIPSSVAERTAIVGSRTSATTKNHFAASTVGKGTHGRSQQDFFLEKEKGPPNCPGRGKSYPGECPVEAAQIRSLAEINGTSLQNPSRDTQEERTSLPTFVHWKETALPILI
jgi:hypothetical protein